MQCIRTDTWVLAYHKIQTNKTLLFWQTRLDWGKTDHKTMVLAGQALENSEMFVTLRGCGDSVIKGSRVSFN